MAKGQNTFENIKWLIIGAIIAVIVPYLFNTYISAPQQELSHPPVPGALAKFQNSFCPVNLSFTQNKADFTVYYSNDSDTSGIFGVTLSSDKVLSKYDAPTTNFAKTTYWPWRVSGNAKELEYSFILDLNQNENPADINIGLKLDCQFATSKTPNNPCGNIVKNCPYSRNGYLSGYTLTADN